MKEQTPRPLLPWVIGAVAVIVGCFAVNLGGAWMGDPAGVWQLAITLLYTVFWAAFTLVAGKGRVGSRIVFVFSLLTFIAAAHSLIMRLISAGFVLTALVSALVSVPFYGLRLFMGWTPLYATVTALALLWVICTGYGLRKQNAR